MSTRPWGHLRPPTRAQLVAHADALGWELSPDEIEYFHTSTGQVLAGLDEFEDLSSPQASANYRGRDPGRRPRAGEDPFNSVIRFCLASMERDGPLQGVTFGVKDSIAVAGIPVTNGSRRQPQFVPSIDATVVERLLNAGAVISAKTNMEDYGLGLGEGSAFGSARNPFNPGYSPGGSSSGAAVGVATGMFDMALGVDQGGSIRIPASWCGVVGMKPTRGLVPTSGIIHVSHTLDHVGPITRTIAENARVLDVIAGSDDRDPQWGARAGRPGSFDFAGKIDAGVNGLRIGVLLSPILAHRGPPDVLAEFQRGLAALTSNGALLTSVAAPLWFKASAISFATLASSGAQMVLSNGTGHFQHLGYVDPQMVASLAAQSRVSCDDFPPMLKLLILVQRHVHDQYSDAPFVMAHNLRRELRQQVDELLRTHDAIVLPTVPASPHPLFEGRVDISEFMGRTIYAAANTSAASLTGHPALTVPCGHDRQGFPVGFQIVARHFDDGTCYQIGAQIENAIRHPAELGPGQAGLAQTLGDLKLPNESGREVTGQ